MICSLVVIDLGMVIISSLMIKNIVGYLYTSKKDGNVFKFALIIPMLKFLLGLDKGPSSYITFIN
jgi:hypothetical protein